MLDHLRGEDRPERAVAEALEVLVYVGVRRVETELTAMTDHSRIDVYTLRADAFRGEQREKLSPAAAHVEHRLVTAHQGQVRALRRRHARRRPAKKILEGDVARLAVLDRGHRTVAQRLAHR